jgi:pyruvate/2-oxoglutarate dehydrogenase complex dihydrolipoamide acyltransferase (E2) component
MKVTFEIVSNCHGVVESLLQTEGSYVCEHEVLCVVKTSGGKLVEVPAAFSGYLDSYQVRKGDLVCPEMLVARLTEEALALCASSD